MSWIEVPDGSDFPIENLPYGAFLADDAPHLGMAIGDSILDLTYLEQEDRLPGDLAAGSFQTGSLNRFMEQGGSVWRAVREAVTELIEGGPPIPASVVPRRGSELLLPFQVADYVDFYSSLEHATNLGRMFRPDGEPLLPNWRHLPVGYHGRSGTVVVSGTPVVRPCGQRKPDDGPPEFGPTRMLDIELEMGFVVGTGNALGQPIPIEEAEEHIFGMVLVNDWSARDIQSWEYVPLGPFLGKSFATSISPWVVTLDALEPHRVPPPSQDPEPLRYLSWDADRGFDIELEILLAPQGEDLETISTTNFRHMYWTIAQQLAHATANGARARTGDLNASGTISGPSPDSYGSLIELTWRGTRPLKLESGATRAFLEDGDTVVLRGRCGSGDRPSIGFGEVRGTVEPALTAPESPPPSP